MKVPFLDLSFQHQPLRSDIVAAFEWVLDSNQFILGIEVETFEDAIAEYCGTRYAIGVSSGTDALLACLLAIGVAPGDLVITTAFSFFATAGSIVRVGAQPIFVDIDADTFNLCPDALEATWCTLSSEEQCKVKAIIPVHLFGQCADMKRILKFAEAHNLVVIEDAAQAIGAQYSWDNIRGYKIAGTMGTMGCLSFFPSKNLGGLGDGGMILTDDEAYATRLRQIRRHGAESKNWHTVPGGNFRLDALQAAILTVKLKSLNLWHRVRNENAAHYRELFLKSNLQRFVRLPVVASTSASLEFAHIYNQYVIQTGGRTERQKLQSFLKARDINTAVYYPHALYEQPCLAAYTRQGVGLPISRRAAGEVLALPIYPGLTPIKRVHIVQSISAFYESYAIHGR